MTALKNNKVDMRAICNNLVYCGLTSVNVENNNTVIVNTKTEDDFLKIIKTSWDDDELIWGDGTVDIEKYGCRICLLDDSTVEIIGIPVKRFCNMLKKEITKYNKMIATRDEYVHDLVINGLD